jgi:hypothetical protein
MATDRTGARPPSATGARPADSAGPSRAARCKGAEALCEPSPPVAKQIQRLMRKFASLRQAAAGGAARDLRALADGFQADFGAAVAEVCRYFQAAARAGDRAHIAAALATLDEQVPTLESLLDDLHAVLAQCFDDAVGAFLPGESDAALPLDFAAFANATAHRFMDLIWRFCDRRLDAPSPDDARAFAGLRTTVARRISLHHRALDDLHWRVAQRLHGLFVLDAERPGAPPCGPCAVDAIAAPMFAAIRRSRADFLPIVQRFWQRDRSVEAHAVVVNLLDVSLTFTEKTARFVNGLPKDAADFAFLRRESGLLYENLVDTMKSFWAVAFEDNRFHNVMEFGQIIVDVINSENEEKQLMPLTDVAKILELACEYHDTGAIGEMATPILIPLLDTESRRLAELRAREIRLIWEIPKRFPRATPEEEDVPELSPDEIDARKAEFQRDYKSHSSEIERESMLCSTVLEICHRSAFAHSQKWPADREPPAQQLPDFVEYENTRITKSVEFIESLEKIKERLFGSIRADAEQPNLTDDEVLALMQYDEILQIDTLRLSAERTEREIEVSRRNLLMVFVRRLDLPAARRLVRQLRDSSEKRIAECTKKREDRKGELDVKSVRSLDEMIIGNSFSPTRILAPCIDAALRDVVEGTIWNYQQNVAIVEQEFAKTVEQVEKERSERIDVVVKQTDAARLVLRQKNDVIAAGEDQRREVLFADTRKRIQMLIDAKQYEEADVERKRLMELMEEAKQKTQLEIVRRGKAQTRVTGDKEKRHRDVIDQAHKAKLLKMTQDRDRLLGEQQKLFASALRGQLKKLVAWVIELTAEQTPKKEFMQKFEKTAKAILSGKHMDELLL